MPTKEKMDKSTGRNSIQFDRPLQQAFSNWCDGEGRKMAPTAAAILKWFIGQDQIVQDFILARPQAAGKLAECLEAMAVLAKDHAKLKRVGHVTNHPTAQEQRPAQRNRS